ncbi:MAG TPA: response regulator [Burkholderiaceae bacterium]
MRILLVEDDLPLAVMAAKILTTVGHQVIGPVTSFAAALHAAREHSIDLAFVDIDLNVKDAGIDLSIELRDSYGIQTIFTSHDAPGALSFHSTALGFLPKPYLMSDLAHTATFAHAFLTSRQPPLPPKPAALELF